jgi:hypothetical protein
MLVRTRSVFSYQSSAGGVTYTFDIVLDAQGIITIKNIQGPIASTAACSTACSTDIPEDVLNDMQEAKCLVELLMSVTEVAFGQLVFTGQTELPGTIPVGVLNNTNYRVVYTDPCGTLITTENKTVTTFDAVVGVSYGTPADPITVDYSVLVSTAQNSDFGGTVTFNVGTGPTVDVTFPEPVPCTAYRVVLSPDGFYVPRVIDKTINGFTIELGFTPTGAETFVVGFDVFA